MLRQDVQVTSGNTFENAENLADTALTMLKERYEGTTLGRQELYAEVIEDLEGALWNSKMIDQTRISEDEERELQKIIVAIDPAVTANENSDETGIIVVGKDHSERYYVLEDISGRYTPDQWGRKAIGCFYEWGADRIVAEVNNGGDLVERLLRSIDNNIPYRSVRATRGKLTRAEPISALYEQKRVHHVGYLSELSRSRGEVNWRIS